jgi:acetyl-CoA C-acetyltransferase
MRQAVIVSAARTPIGTFQGALNSVPATVLGSIAIARALKKIDLAGDDVDEVLMGNVLSAGLGQGPARQAAIGAALPHSVGCTTVNKVCGSGLKAVMLAAQAIVSGDVDIVVAGGMESMSNAPYLLMQGRTGYRLGSGELVDSLIHDGQWDVYNQFHMGAAAEVCARILKISREEQDEHAAASYERARDAQGRNAFAREIVGVSLSRETLEEVLISEDEEPRRFNALGLRTLRPAFEKHGSVTAGNGAPIGDGAAALVIMSDERAQILGLKPMARIVAFTTYAGEPTWFTTAPAKAIQALLQRTDRSVAEMDLFEINEVFAVCSIAVNRELGLDPAKVNVRGGSVALGHPIGASGARILVTLIHALEDLNLSTGVASLCIGGGEAVAMMVERA